jgi:hypothetical protein
LIGFAPRGRLLNQPTNYPINKRSANEEVTVDHSAEQVVVIDQDGVRGTIDKQALARRDQQEVLITYNGDHHVRVPMKMLRREADGSYYLPLRLSTLETNARFLKTGEATVIPVVEEEAHI